jgi:hypothetical protein
MGMLAQGKNQFVGKDCPENTYGAAGKVYGWAAAPCKPCPRNMITDGARKVNNSDVCINDDGFGYASEGEHHAPCTSQGHVFVVDCPCSAATYCFWGLLAQLDLSDVLVRPAATAADFLASAAPHCLAPYPSTTS